MDILMIALALVPAIFLMGQVYKKDRLEKEPVKLLIGLVILGALSCLPASILENLFGPLVDETELVGSFIMYFLIVAVSEEVCKYVFLRLRTKKEKEFNCSFDGAVYAVFTSLGFAALENILYVTSFGVGNGVVRAFTAIPGHACFGLVMGVYYGKAHGEELRGNTAKAKSYTRKALLYPILLHGAYDFSTDLGLIPFIAVLAAIYIIGLRLLKKASAEDTFIVPMPAPEMQAAQGYYAAPSYGQTEPTYTAAAAQQTQPSPAPVYAPAAAPVQSVWFCPTCGARNTSKFCPECGTPDPRKASQVSEDRFYN